MKTAAQRAEMSFTRRLSKTNSNEDLPAMEVLPKEAMAALLGIEFVPLAVVVCTQRLPEVSTTCAMAIRLCLRMIKVNNLLGRIHAGRGALQHKPCSWRCLIPKRFNGFSITLHKLGAYRQPAVFDGKACGGGGGGSCFVVARGGRGMPGYRRAGRAGGAGVGGGGGDRRSRGDRSNRDCRSGGGGSFDGRSYTGLGDNGRSYRGLGGNNGGARRDGGRRGGDAAALRWRGGCGSGEGCLEGGIVGLDSTETPLELGAIQTPVELLIRDDLEQQGIGMHGEAVQLRAKHVDPIGPCVRGMADLVLMATLDKLYKLAREEAALTVSAEVQIENRVDVPGSKHAANGVGPDFGIDPLLHDVEGAAGTEQLLGHRVALCGLGGIDETAVANGIDGIGVVEGTLITGVLF